METDNKPNVTPLFTVGKYISDKGPVTIDSSFRPVMGTFAHIIAITADSNTAQKSAEAAFDELVDADNLMSDYKPDSQLNL